MPTYLRRFYINKLTEYKNKESEEIKKSKQKNQSRIASTPSTNPRLKR